MRVLLIINAVVIIEFIVYKYCSLLAYTVLTGVFVAVLASCYKESPYVSCMSTGL
jgi:hypothetical protein